MRYLYFLILTLLIASCSNDFKKYEEIGLFKIYELQCDGKFYMTIEDCSCKNLPENYFTPKGDKNDNFYEFYVRLKDDRIKIYSLYDEFQTFGDIKSKVDFIVFQNNAEFIEFRESYDLKIFRGYLHGNMNP